MSSNTSFTRDNLDDYLKALAKQFKKLSGSKMPAEIILIGGASVLINYGFRNSTSDVDAIIQASSVMKEAINSVSDQYNLPNGWLNADFTKTKSYTPKLVEHSVYYKTFSNILAIRTVAAEYLIAMKLMAGRKYKFDLSDVVGILHEHHAQGNPISWEQIDSAINILYGGWHDIPEYSQTYIASVMKDENYKTIYQSIIQAEQANKDVLLDFEKHYPGIVNDGNIDDILQKRTPSIKGQKEHQDNER